MLAATIYEQHASLDAEGVQTCIGDACFRVTFLVLALLALVGAGIAYALGKYIGACLSSCYERGREIFRPLGPCPSRW